MKKVVYIAVGAFALGIVSCSKQEIQPNSNAVTLEPMWKSDDVVIVDPNIENEGGDGAIVDPNLENEKDKKSK